MTDRIAQKIRTKLDLGVLPWDQPPKIYTRYGDGQPCEACDTPILPAQSEYSFDMADGYTVRLHSGCHGLWTAERLQRWRSK